MTSSELLALKALVAAEEARQTAAQLSDSPIATTDGVLQTKGDPMYSWISPRPYDHYGRFKVWFRDIQGRRKSISFKTEDEARTWIANAQKLLVSDGRPIETVISAYLASLEGGELQPQSVVTLGYRIRAIAKGRERVAVESFPWPRAWDETIAKTSRATQAGTLAALHGLVTFAGLPAKALDGIKVRGSKRAGKPQLTIDEGRKFVAAALEADEQQHDPLALTAVVMALTGCRPSEALALQARDVDDGGAVLHVYGTKTAAAKRPASIEPEFRSWLLHLTQNKSPTDLLFVYQPQRQRRHQDEGKARRDALLRRVRALCRAAGVPEVVSHSMRGLNATLRKTGGADDSSITRALGHRSIVTAKRAYFAPGVVDLVDSKRAHGRLLPSAA